MFFTFSKTIARVGGFRIGIGKRITSKDAWWMCIILFFIGIFKLCWYVMLLGFWLTYAFFYGMWWCCKKIWGVIARLFRSARNAEYRYVDNRVIDSASFKTDENLATGNIEMKAKYCTNCGSEVAEGNLYCVNCGTKI